MFVTANKVIIPLRRNGIIRFETVLSTSNGGTRHMKNSASISCSYSTTPATSALPERHGTTILCVRKGDKVCMIGDSMVSQGSMIVKPNAIKIRRIVPKGNNVSSSTSSSNDSATATTTTTSDTETTNDNNTNVTIVGFAGSTADAFTLMERLENKLDEYPGQLIRSCVELAKGWRTDKYLRRLEASLIVTDAYHSFELTGNGDVLESHDGVLGVGSGSPYAIGMSY
jgi:ATP-dependent HslUV protease, peptidase subunit HslV